MGSVTDDIVDATDVVDSVSECIFPNATVVVTCVEAVNEEIKLACAADVMSTVYLSDSSVTDCLDNVSCKGKLVAFSGVRCFIIWSVKVSCE